MGPAKGPADQPPWTALAAPAAQHGTQTLCPRAPLLQDGAPAGPDRVQGHCSPVHTVALARLVPREPPPGAGGAQPLPTPGHAPTRPACFCPVTPGTCVLPEAMGGVSSSDHPQMIFLNKETNTPALSACCFSPLRSASLPFNLRPAVQATVGEGCRVLWREALNPGSGSPAPRDPPPRVPTAHA